MSSTVLQASPSTTEVDPERLEKPAKIGTKHHYAVKNRTGFSQTILNIGFGVALVLAAACLALGAVYLYMFLKSTNAGIDQLLTNTANQVSNEVLYIAINARLVMARVALLSCGVFVGMSFGFLGFALFLLGIKEEMNVDAGSEGYSVKIARMSPGVFVILCATILIGVCISRQTPFSYENFQKRDSPTPAASEKLDLPDPGNDLEP
jgi:hypothetical protein